MVGSKLIQLYGQGTFIILLGLLIVTQIAVEVTHGMVRSRQINMVGFKPIQLYGQGTFKILLGLLIVTQVAVEVTQVLVSFRDMFGSKLVQKYG